MPGLDPAAWTPRELRHPFVSLLSDAVVPLEEIPRLVGHSGTTVTDLVYRHQIRPVIQTGATVMDQLFGSGVRERSHSVGHSPRGMPMQTTRAGGRLLGGNSRTRTCDSLLVRQVL